MSYAPSTDVVISIRAKISSILLVASISVMATSALFAMPRHDICDAMRHACDKVDEALSCCCGDRSESNPSQVPGDRADTAAPPHLTVSAFVTVAMPAATALFVHTGLLPLARPPDLPILFGDLRI